MASWRWKHGHVVVEYWDSDAGKKVMLKPRSDYAYLDRWTDSERDAWVETWEQDHGPKSVKVKSSHVLEMDEVKGLFDTFLKEYQVIKDLSASTVEDEERRFYGHIVPIMVGKFQKKDVRTWGENIPALTTELIAKGDLDRRQINKCLGLLKRFSRALKTRKILSQSWDAEYTKVAKKPTRLLARKHPAYVFAMCMTEPDLRFRFAGLAAFFGPGRPEEIGPSEKEDWITGERALAKSTTYHDLQRHSIGLSFFPYIEPELPWLKSKRPGSVEADSAQPVNPESAKFPGVVRKLQPRITSDKFRKVLGSQITLGSKLVWHVQRRWTRQGEIDNTTKKANLQKHKSQFQALDEEMESLDEYVTIWYPPAAREMARILRTLPPGPIFKMSRGHFFRLWRRKLGKRLQATLMDLRRGAGNFLGRILRLYPSILQEVMRHESLAVTKDYMREPQQEVTQQTYEVDYDDV